MTVIAVRHKHVQLDQRKLDRARRVLTFATFVGRNALTMLMGMPGSVS